MTGRTTALNTVQKIGQILRGSVITVLGSGGFTEAALTAAGVISTYTPPAGKKARIKGDFVVSAMGTNTQISCGIFDSGTGRTSNVALLTAVGKQSFECVLQSTNTLNFVGNNAANDGAATCQISIEELPA